ncbi:MAG TPA: hypothetical protein VGA96_01045, partial [Fibrella sp.]
GLSYSPATRILQGTPTTAGVWTITATGVDNQGACVSTSFKFTAGASTVGVGKPLRLLEAVLNCSTGLFEFRSADGDGTPIEYSIDRLVGWSTQTSFTLAAAMRTGQQLDIKARQSGRVIEGVYYTKCATSNQLPTVK